jgi:hypothetical protein
LNSMPESVEHSRDFGVAIAFIPQLKALILSNTTLEPIVDANLASIRASVYTMTVFASLGF